MAESEVAVLRGRGSARALIPLVRWCLAAGKGLGSSDDKYHDPVREKDCTGLWYLSCAQGSGENPGSAGRRS